MKTLRRRLIAVAVIAVALLLSVDRANADRRNAVALSFADFTGNLVNFGSAAATDNMATGSVVIWVYPTSVANALRTVLAKEVSGGGDAGWAVFKRGANGTNWSFFVGRATDNQTVDITGMVANEWQFLAYTWNITSGGPTSYRGTLNSPAVNISVSPVNGTGAQNDDSAANITVGAKDSGTDAAPMRVGFFGVYNRVLSLGDIRSLQFRPRPTAGTVLFAWPGKNGRGPVYDESGNNHHGTITGAVPTSDTLPLRPLFRRVG